MGCRGVPILLLRLLSCFLKTSADFWSLNGSSIHTGCSTGTTGGLETFDSLNLMKDKIVESTSLFGYFSLEKNDLSSLHSTSKSSFIDDRRYARSTIVFKSEVLYLPSTCLWKCRFSITVGYKFRALESWYVRYYVVVVTLEETLQNKRNISDPRN